MNATQLKKAKRESHRLQFGGMDYQKAAYEVLGNLGATTEGGPEVTEEELIEVESSPEQGCDCGFCATAPWE